MNNFSRLLILCYFSIRTIVKIDMYGPKSLEKGWAEFKSEEEAQQALKLSGFSIRDQALQVTPFIHDTPPPKKEKDNKRPKKQSQPVPQPQQSSDIAQNKNESKQGLQQNATSTNQSTTQQPPNQTPKTNNPPNRQKKIKVN